MKTRQEKREQMFAIIRDYKAGAGTQISFCEKAGIGVQCFRYWLNKFKETEEHPSGFVRLVPDQGALAEGMELCFPNGVSVRLGQRPDMVMVSQLIRLW